MKKYKPIAVFLASALLLYIGWFLVYELWLHPKGYLDLLVIKNSIFLSKHFLTAFGFHIDIENTRKIFIESKAGIFVGDECNGLSLFALFAGFIISYPGSIKSKVLFIPIGILFIHLLNVLRICGLLILQLYAPQFMEFNHTYTFTILVYGFIFLLWMLWINKFSAKRK